MPTYEYQCQACGHQLEAFQRITEPALKDCPACKKPSFFPSCPCANFQNCIAFIINIFRKQ